jgi:hypothetical protein
LAGDRIVQGEMRFNRDNLLFHFVIVSPFWLIVFIQSKFCAQINIEEGDLLKVKKGFGGL